MPQRSGQIAPIPWRDADATQYCSEAAARTRTRTSRRGISLAAKQGGRSCSIGAADGHLACLGAAARGRRQDETDETAIGTDEKEE
ncbi:hypothetical protein CMUS01_14038 [Colletotrichum musicola]|uniref:Uncharacterized protein n=1 Tax=Colletotrichum musicola TaxID=2175873 RepID=A0A8H6MTL6_9PEZI|nr:hypothetical protein CMUS01_14038 [Colletotrichum musicola]